MDSTCGSTGRAARSVRKSSMARPKPLPSSVLCDVLVFDTSVRTLRPNVEIIDTSRLPSPQLSPPGVP